MTWLVITGAEILAALVGFLVGTMYPGFFTEDDDGSDDGPD